MRFPVMLTMVLALTGGIAAAAGPVARAIKPNSFATWSAADGRRSFRALGVTVTPLVPRSNGPRSDDAPPVFIVSAPPAPPIRLTLSDTSADHDSSIGIGEINKSEGPAVIVQGWTGGAHCCTQITAAVRVGKVFRAVDLGTWDGESVPWPKDISGDGIGDFVMVDNAFLYAFGCYACSYAPPQVINIRGGRRVDASAEPQFRRLFERDLQRLRPLCAKGDNPACAAYAADAARLGRFAAEWPFVLKSYSRTDTWDLPTGCRVDPGDNACPDAQTINYGTYPEALRAFLRQNGYIG